MGATFFLHEASGATVGSAIQHLKDDAQKTCGANPYNGTLLTCIDVKEVLLPNNLNASVYSKRIPPSQRTRIRKYLTSTEVTDKLESRVIYYSYAGVSEYTEYKLGVRKYDIQCAQGYTIEILDQNGFSTRWYKAVNSKKEAMTIAKEWFQYYIKGGVMRVITRDGTKRVVYEWYPEKVRTSTRHISAAKYHWVETSYNFFIFGWAAT